jgi:glucose-fructose oxidoreductase
MTVRRGRHPHEAALRRRHALRHRRLLHQRGALPVRAEPTEVVAISVNSGVKALSRSTSRPAAILRFDGGRVASFVTSFNGGDVAEYRIVGSKGDIHVDPAYEYAEGLGYTLTVDGKRSARRSASAISSRRSCCTSPTASGTTARRSRPARRGCRMSASCRRSTIGRRAAGGRDSAVREGARPSGRQRITRPGVRKPALVKVQSASVD